MIWLNLMVESMELIDWLNYLIDLIGWVDLLNSLSYRWIDWLNSLLQSIWLNWLVELSWLSCHVLAWLICAHNANWLVGLTYDPTNTWVSEAKSSKIIPILFKKIKINTPKQTNNRHVMRYQIDTKYTINSIASIVYITLDLLFKYYSWVSTTNNGDTQHTQNAPPAGALTNSDAIRFVLLWNSSILRSNNIKKTHTHIKAAVSHKKKRTHKTTDHQLTAITTYPAGTIHHEHSTSS